MGLSIHRDISLFCQLRGSRSKEHTCCPDLEFWSNYSGKGTGNLEHMPLEPGQVTEETGFLLLLGSKDMLEKMKAKSPMQACQGDPGADCKSRSGNKWNKKINKMMLDYNPKNKYP